METYKIFFDLSMIVLSAEIFGLISRKCKAPQVVGQIIAGLILGPSVLNLVDITSHSSVIPYFAEVGVMLIMFSAGLETNLKELMHTGLLALIIACAGVFVPLLGGFLLFSYYYYGGIPAASSVEFFKALFIGTIMTATSVGITVQVLKELGKLKTKVGQIILSAAIIDDVIGIVVLTFVLSLSGAEGASEAKSLPDVILSILLFFAFTIAAGILVYNLFKIYNVKYPHHRRLPILGLSFAMFMAFCAEQFFGIADITGAYAAGIILCNLKDSEYLARRMDISSYMVFGPVFFVSIGLKTQFSNLDSSIWIFSLMFVLVALLTKVIACGFIAKLAKFSFKDSLKVGVGMMTRGEVALIVTTKGLAVGLVEQKFFAPVILLIICSSIATPILFKILFRNDPDGGDSGEDGEPRPDDDFEEEPEDIPAAAPSSS